MYNSNDYLAWQFIAILLLVIAVMLAIANIKKQKEINICFKERVSLVKQCNKYMMQLIELRKKLKDYESN